MDCIYIQELLNLPIFKCTHCSRRCQYPVMIADKTGNYCTSCLGEIQYTTVKENTEVNAILEKFPVPCRYVENGCNMVDKIEDVTKHEITCDYRDIVCPLKHFKRCNNNFLYNIPEHFRRHHSRYLLASESNSVTLHLNIRDFINEDEIYLLDIDHENFLLHVKCSQDKNELLYVLYYCGDPGDTKNYQCAIEHRCMEIQTTKMEFALLHESEFSVPMNKTRAIQYNLATLQKCFDNIDVTIYASRRHALAKIKNNDLLNTLKCITCKAYLRDEISQCTRGHSACKECIIDTKKCSACNAAFDGTRNYVLENLCAFIKYPCTNRGCNIYLSSKKITQHELDCRLKEFRCPFLEIFHCQSNDIHTDMIQHIQTEHEDKVSLGNYKERKLALNSVNNEIYCLIAFNNIFRFHIEKNGNIYTFSCKYFGKQSLARLYAFEIGLISQVQPINKMIVKNSWKSGSDDEIWGEMHDYNFSHYVSTSNEILLSYKIRKYHDT